MVVMMIVVGGRMIMFVPMFMPMPVPMFVPAAAVLVVFMIV